MRSFATRLFILVALAICFYAISTAQEQNSATTDKNSSKAQQLKIVPLVTIKPGESKELLLSTWCTVGVTRGGGFGLTEMRDGKPKGDGAKSYSEGGVTLSVPNFEDGAKFASSPEYSLLKERNVDPFKVTISASLEAKPGLLEMHLLDSTCSGDCETDFRVLVVEQ